MKVSIASIVATFLLGIQYILAFFIFKLPGFFSLQLIGWGIWILSIIFGIGPIFIFKKRGGVARGKSYVETTQLVDSSLYAIVRHPQYLAGILFSLSMIFLAQHWLVILLGIICMVLIYIDTKDADQDGIKKFGEAYQDYMQRVPKFNFIYGIFRVMRKNK